MRRAADKAERQLHRGHFAFMRALAQGLDERKSWDRYLRLEGEHADARTVRRTITWIRDAFAAAARREHRPGTARLILLDPERFSRAPALPTLAEFAAAQGLEDFSEAEQIEAYEAAHPNGRRAGQGGQGGQAAVARRARIIGRQLEALRWLETLVAREPRPADGVGGWLNPSVAARLEGSGIATLGDLVGRINTQGERWWRFVPGVGVGKAGRILDWLQAHESDLGLLVGVHGRIPRRAVSAAVLAGVVPSATAVLPYEKFVVPAAFDGRQGHLRAPLAQCRLSVDDDHAAIGAWLASKRPHGDAPSSAEMSTTQRAYRREAERLLLWAVLERRTALSSLTPDDAAAYRSFLAAPPQTWCGPRHAQRWSPLWRPLEGPLSPSALRQALTILRSLYSFWQKEKYVLTNPFAAAVPPAPARSPADLRTLSSAQWKHVNARLETHGNTEPARRLRRGMRWIHATGLRVSEITAARCEDLHAPHPETPGADPNATWLLTVIGRGGRRREVPVPADLVAELQQEIARSGFAPDPAAPFPRDVAILARFGGQGGRPVPWSGSGLYQALKIFLATAADGMDKDEAAQLKKASAHWLRNVHG